METLLGRKVALVVVVVKLAHLERFPGRPTDIPERGGLLR